MYIQGEIVTIAALHDNGYINLLNKDELGTIKAQRTEWNKPDLPDLKLLKTTPEQIQKILKLLSLKILPQYKTDKKHIEYLLPKGNTPTDQILILTLKFGKFRDLAKKGCELFMKLNENYKVSNFMVDSYNYMKDLV